MRLCVHIAVIQICELLGRAARPQPTVIAGVRIRPAGGYVGKTVLAGDVVMGLYRGEGRDPAAVAVIW